MEAVKTCQHEKGGAIGSGRQLEIEIGIGMAVFVRLEANKKESQGESQEQAELELSALVELERPVCPGDRHAGSEQYQRIECRKTPRAHRRIFVFNTRAGSWPSSRKVGPQHFLIS